MKQENDKNIFYLLMMLKCQSEWAEISKDVRERLIHMSVQTAAVAAATAGQDKKAKNQTGLEKWLVRCG